MTYIYTYTSVYIHHDKPFVIHVTNILSFNAVLQLGPPAVVPRPQRTAGQKRGLRARFFSAEKMENGWDFMGLMGFHGDLMGFHGDLMGFHGDLMGYSRDFMVI